MPVNIGPLELIVVLVIALIILGPKRLPDAGRALGSGIRNFRHSVASDTSAEGVERGAGELGHESRTPRARSERVPGVLERDR